MARVRGLGDAERLALNFTTLTATGLLVTGQAFVYQIYATLVASTATGSFSFSDSSSSGDNNAQLDSSRIDFKFGSSAASANSEFHWTRNFIPPIICLNNPNWGNSVGINSVSISYLPAD